MKHSDAFDTLVSLAEWYSTLHNSETVKSDWVMEVLEIATWLILPVAYACLKD
jgi:hypothetical protein